MAQKKVTQAQKKSAQSGSQKQKTTGAKNVNGKNSKQGKDRQQPQSREAVHVPCRGICAAVCLLLFVLFLVIAMNQNGFLLSFIKDLSFGLFGAVSFYVSIPVLLYLFVILAFSGKQPVLLRSCCALGFVFLCGCISHLCAQPIGLGSGFTYLKNLYNGGISSATGGLVCGLLTEGVVAAVGRIFSFIVFILGALLCLLAACRITIPSLIRAIENRPRPEDVLDDPIPEAPEPAAIVVNHIANKRIEHMENRRRLEAQRAAAAAQEAEEAIRQETATSKSRSMIHEIEAEIDTRIPGEQKQDPLPEEVPVQLSHENEQLSEVFDIPAQPAPVAEPEIPQQMPELKLDIPSEKKVTAKEAAQSAMEVAQEIAQNSAVEKPIYCFPPMDLLRPATSGGADGTQEMRENTKRLNETLASFRIEAHISNVTRGPSVTRYEVELEKGVRLNKLTSMADDIALSLGASGVRIAPVPGKISVVGIEVPNQAVTTVSLREVISSGEFIRAKSKSSFAVGKDIGGSCIVGNIAKLPHMLIAGTTGSGKSVCMNSIIISLLYKASPDDVKLIMVDPKMVELGIYNGIPHLLIPVVTDPKKAAGSLQWAVTEMMRRYRTMSDAGVRDLDSYNSMIDGGELEGERLAQVVVIIDELADLMLVAAKEVEESICRIAQMGRAAGIHLIIATQRPSADVITGLMKANIPSRIAFAVASAMESRIILDTVGAEKLVGKGDMLFAPIGSGKPVRVQGCFVSDAEVEAVASFVKEHYTNSYDEKVMEEIEKKAAQTGGKSAPATASDPDPSAAEEAWDEMLPAAVEVILETKQASVSMLQRRLKLGYARAARIVDEMEEHGIVGPFVGSKPRQILVTREQWEQMRSGTPAEQHQEQPQEPNFFDEPVPDEIL